MRRYQVLFATAALYNLVFGAWAGLFPLAFFRWFHLAEPRYPSIWSCLGMVIGLYGSLYAYTACRPDQSDAFVWLGLAGKVLGPIGWLLAVARGELPPRTFTLILANDLIWWFPFLFYLLRHVPERRRIVAWICTALHLGSCMGLLVIRGGTEMQQDIGLRAAWVIEWSAVWTATWVAWSLSSMSLLAFLIAWSAELIELGAARTVAVACCAISAIGLVFDLWGETVNITRLTRPSLSIDDFAREARLYAILGAGIANGLYCVAGLNLSAVAWRIRQLRGWLGILGFAMWTMGLGLTAATLINSRPAMIITGSGVMILFIPWVGGLAMRLGFVAASDVTKRSGRATFPAARTSRA